MTHTSLDGALARVDYKAVVADEWRRGGLDELIDKRVDIAVAEVRDGTSWAELLKSLAYREKAQELATAVAERVYRSDAMKSAIEALATGVGREVGRAIELGTLDAAEPAQECLKAFLGPRYGSTIAKAVANDAGKEFEIDPAKNSAAVSTGAVMAQGSDAVAGAVVLIVRRQLSNMAARVGQRIVGAVLSRLVSVVAGGIGLVLIAKDIWDFRHGVLPIVANEMKDKGTKAKVQEELAKSIAEQIGEHAREISASTADRIVEIWQEFRRGHAKVLELADRHPEMKRLLETLKPEDMPRLDEIVALVLSTEGEASLLARLNDGSLGRAVTQLPPAGMEIARETRSLTTALAWTQLAGTQLPKVIAFELHKQLKPDAITAAGLKRLLAFDERLPIQRLGGLTSAARDALFDLSDPDLKALAKGLSGNELETLASYLTGLEKPAAQRVLTTVAKEPARMQLLASSRVRDAIIASKNQLAAVDMMLRADPGFDIGLIRHDVLLTTSGQVSPILLWDRHPAATGGFGALIVAMGLMLRRLFGRRRSGGPTPA